MRNRARTVLIAAAALSLLAGASQTAQAQQQVSDGRALEANPQVGSGGANDPITRPDFRARNDIITGNVGGGRGFRGDVGYGAAGEFRGELGTDELFDFRARSLPMQPGQPAESVYRDFSAPSPSRAPSAGQFDIGAYGGAGGRPGQTPSDRLGTDGEPWSAGRALEASLFDTDHFRPPRWDDPAGTRDVDAFWGMPDEDFFDDSELFTHPQDLQRWREDRGLQRLDRLEGTLDDDPLRSLDPDDEQTLQQLMRPSLVIGQQFFDRRDGRPADGRSIGEQIQRIEQQMFSRLRDHADTEAGRDVYRDRLATLLHGTERPDEDPIGHERRMAWEDEDAFEEMPAWQRDHARRLAELQREREQMTQQQREEEVFPLEEPDEQELATLEGQRQAMLEEFFAGDDELARPWDLWELEHELEEDEEMQPLAEFLERLDQADLPALETLAGTDQTRANELLASAEQDLAEGLYFEAENSYRRVMQIAPDEPLARAGLVHAQLGAGMIHSAALNLREMFEHYPELIDVRYEAHLLPGRERLQWLQGELRDMMQRGGTNPAEAGLVLAYLGHQSESRQLVRFGLARAETAAPDDALLPVLRTIWLDEQDQPDVEPEDELELLEQQPEQ